MNTKGSKMVRMIGGLIALGLLVAVGGAVWNSVRQDEASLALAAKGPVEAPEGSEVLEVEVSGPVETGTSWVGVEFEPAGDVQQWYNVDHYGKSRVTIAWFWAGASIPLSPCTVYIVTAPDGGRFTAKGAYRTFEWTGQGEPNNEVLLETWIHVLESEPRGACAYKGAYTVTWQSASEPDATATPVTATPATATPATATPATATPQPSQPEWIETAFITIADLPFVWTKQGDDVAVCWGGNTVTVYTTSATLDGDACRIGHLVPITTPEANGQYWSSILIGEYGGTWSVVVE